jgi:hypothetical protein
VDLYAQVQTKYAALRPFLDERRRRLWAANEALALGRGGVQLVAAATGLARSTLGDGLRELRAALATRAAGAPAGAGAGAGAVVAEAEGVVVAEAEGVVVAEAPPLARQRRAGGGRKALVVHDPGLVPALEALIEPTTRGDPQSPLRWTTKSTRKLADALTRQGHPVSAASVATLLHRLKYRLHALRKTTEGASHADRDAQFAHISATVATFQERGQPVVSVDAKKKELVGDFKNGGREWQPDGQPEAVRVHDFPDKALGKVTPYGVFDLTANQGWVSVGTDHDTATFAVDSVQRWWDQMGAPLYREATDLLLTADGGGSNSSRSRLWKVELQRLADATGLRVHVCHFPPGTSTWNKIEHGLFCHITQNWRGRPLVSHEVIVELIGHTTTTKGLRVQAELHQRPYPTGPTVSDDTLATVRLERAAFHGDWNSTITPRDLSE